MKVKTKYLKIISDIHTPVGVYPPRDLYSKNFSFESSDYKGSENSLLSFICFDSKAQISVHNDIVKMTFDNKEVKKNRK